MRLFIITPVFDSSTSSVGTTPVVHYFAREWAKLGIEVHVYHILARFPRLFYSFSRIFQHKLNTLLGSLVPVDYPYSSEFEVDGVKVHRVTLNKIKPHSRYSSKEIQRVVETIESGFSQFGIPDGLIGHWHNPSIDIISTIKRRYDIRTCLVLHENAFMMERYYGNELYNLLNAFDVLGFRNKTAQCNYISKYGLPKSSFIAYSGVSSEFINAGVNNQPIFDNGIDHFVYVGSLIARKHPIAIIHALDVVYSSTPYYITYVGDGVEKAKILSNIESINSVVFTGRLERKEIINHLRKAQVFIMISEKEVFGLVYLEAMALGLIPIGSRNEGIDGVIVDGENGFLCNAGDEIELASILRRIREMTRDELIEMSNNAKQTAMNYTDNNVAKKYLQSIFE